MQSNYVATLDMHCGTKTSHLPQCQSSLRQKCKEHTRQSKLTYVEMAQKHPESLIINIRTAFILQELKYLRVISMLGIRMTFSFPKE